MSKLPEFRSGMGFTDMSASEMNELVRRVQQDTDSGGPGELVESDGRHRRRMLTENTAVQFSKMYAEWEPGNNYIEVKPVSVMTSDGGTVDPGAASFFVLLVVGDDTVAQHCGYTVSGMYQYVPYIELAGSFTWVSPPGGYDGTPRLALYNPMPEITALGQVYQAAAFEPTNMVAQPLRIY